MASPIVRQSPGYYLDTGPDDVDLTVLRRTQPGGVVARRAIYFQSCVNTSVCIQQLPLLPGIPERLAGGRHTAVGDFAEVMPSAAIGAVHADPVDPMPTHEDHALLRELGPRRSTQFWPRVVPDRSHRRRSSS